MFRNPTGENILRKLSSIMYNNSKSVKSIFAQQIETKQTLDSWNCPNFRMKALSLFEEIWPIPSSFDCFDHDKFDHSP